MANLVEKNLGPVSAYAYAKKNGYVGTETEFAKEQAEFANNAKLVDEAKNVAVAKAGEALTSATHSKTSETNAKASETNAKASESNATASATKAGLSETKAKTSETNALAAEANTKKVAAAYKPEVERAIANADAMAAEASKVNISVAQNPTGITVTTTDRTGKVTETVLDTVTQLKSWKDIQTVVRQGNAKKLIQPGDIFNAKRTDPSTGKVNEIPWHVADVRNITTPKGEVKEAVIIQMHRVLPEDVMFDAWEAFYIAKEGLAPGTYHVVIAEKWGDYHNVGDTWSFTLSKPVPKGGLLGGFHDTPYSGFGNAKVESFNSLADTTPIESVVPRKGTEGVKLGDFTFAGNAQLNSIQRSCYGYNNYKQSYQRQYLNNSGKGWWKAQNEYDLPPSNYKDRFGFMTGWDDEFLNVLRPFKSVIARNNTTDGGGTDEVNDIFVLPSLEEMNVKKQVSGEGPVLPYWKDASADGAEFPWYTNTPELVHLDTNGVARFVRFRSAYVSVANYAWLADPSGLVNNYYARSAYSGAPLAAIY